ncbi:hypothetical protein [Hydrogenophaga sp. NFH-34]|uniref:hypothetical protein n=1 Tax=Hydrogenophaga sp. NFH-34 TaxID=2744446 RepID=UPI001F270EB4|nr:hypothetical protein [Hydrogenophaga sp. NFH-34]
MDTQSAASILGNISIRPASASNPSGAPTSAYSVLSTLPAGTRQISPGIIRQGNSYSDKPLGAVARALIRLPAQQPAPTATPPVSPAATVLGQVDPTSAVRKDPANPDRLSGAAATLGTLPTARPVAPGVYNHGRGQYSDNAGGMNFGSFTGQPSARNSAAAEALASLPSNRGTAPTMSAAQALAQPPSQNLTPQTSGSGYGLLDQGYRDRRAAMMAAEQHKPGARAALAALLQRQNADAQRGFDQQQATADRTFRASESAAERGLKREGMASDAFSALSRLNIDQQRVNLDATAPARTAAQQLAHVRQSYLDADNPQDEERAARRLATINGKPVEGTEKPLPVAALKMQQDDIDAMGLASTTSADLGAIAQQIDDGTLNLGLVRNAWNKARNSVGMSTEESRALGSFQSTLEKLRNDSLRLNKGVQTEGDAQRAWNELFQSLSDPRLVRQRLGEIRAINERAAAMRGSSVQTLRENYGAAPLDMSRHTTVQPVLGQQQAAEAQQGQRTIARTGTMNGRRVVQYADGSISYAD